MALPTGATERYPRRRGVLERPVGGDDVHIGQPKRIIEVEPATIPIPEVLPEPELLPELVPSGPAPEEDPAHRDPERQPAEPVP